MNNQEMEINDLIKSKAKEYNLNISKKVGNEKSYFHPNSVMNISNRIVLYNDEKANELKQKLLDYFLEIESMDYNIENKYKSSILYNYLLPLRSYLLYNDQFIAKADLHLLVIIGFVFDLVFYKFFLSRFIPIFIILFSIFGIYRRIRAKSKGKFSAMFW